MRKAVALHASGLSLALVVALLPGCTPETYERETTAEYVLRNIESPGGEDGSSTPGSAANVLERKSNVPPAYTTKFDLSGLPAYSPEAKVSGHIRFWGNNYINASGLAKAWTEGFQQFHPDVTFELVLPTAAVATPSLYLDLADVSMTHAPNFYDSLVHLRILGYEPTGFRVVTGSLDVGGWMNAMAIVVHKDNPLTHLTMQQLDGIFGAERIGGWDGTTWRPDWARGPEQNIRTWDQLGLKGSEWKGRKIQPYGYSVIYSTALEFSRRVLQSSNKWNESLRDYGNLKRPDGTVYGQAAQIADQLKNDKYGIAIIRYNPTLTGDKFRILALARDDKSPAAELTLNNVQNRSYPLVGDMSFFVSVKPGTRMKPEVKEFVRYVLSREGQTLVQDVDGKYLPLTAEVVNEERAALEKF